MLFTFFGIKTIIITAGYLSPGDIRDCYKFINTRYRIRKTSSLTLCCTIMSVQVSTDNDFNSQLETNEKVIVKYFANWCGSCKLFAPKFRRLSDDERFSDVTFLDVNAEENAAARKFAGVDNLPFFAIFKNGVLVEGSATHKEENVVGLLNKLS